jgi:hypothetical protein
VFSHTQPNFEFYRVPHCTKTHNSHGPPHGHAPAVAYRIETQSRISSTLKITASSYPSILNPHANGHVPAQQTFVSNLHCLKSMATSPILLIHEFGAFLYGCAEICIYNVRVLSCVKNKIPNKFILFFKI